MFIKALNGGSLGINLHLSNNGIINEGPGVT